MLPQENFETAAYYSANQIKKVKALKCELANQLDSRETLKSIADRYGMSLTALKDCFKAVYGKPIHAFQREYKMQTATKLLVKLCSHSTSCFNVIFLSTRIFCSPSFLRPLKNTHPEYIFIIRIQDASVKPLENKNMHLQFALFCGMIWTR